MQIKDILFKNNNDLKNGIFKLAFSYFEKSFYLNKKNISEIINAYYNYKNSLSQLKEIRSRELLYNKNYAKAMDEEDFLEIAVSSSLYQDMQIEEEKYMQLSKKYHLELQRLAGKKVVDNLNLYQYDYDSELLGGKNVK